MHHLETLPDSLVKKLMHDGILRISDGIFNTIHTDQLIESTYMLLGKGPGGAKGLTVDKRLMTVWALSFATCGEAVQSFREMLSGDECKSQAST